MRLRQLQRPDVDPAVLAEASRLAARVGWRSFQDAQRAVQRGDGATEAQALAVAKVALDAILAAAVPSLLFPAQVVQLDHLAVQLRWIDLAQRRWKRGPTGRRLALIRALAEAALYQTWIDPDPLD